MVWEPFLHKKEFCPHWWDGWAHYTCVEGLWDVSLRRDLFWSGQGVHMAGGKRGPWQHVDNTVIRTMKWQREGCTLTDHLANIQIFCSQYFPQCRVNVWVMESEPGVTQNQRSLTRFEQERFMMVTGDCQRKWVPYYLLLHLEALFKNSRGQPSCLTLIDGKPACCTYLSQSQSSIMTTKETRSCRSAGSMRVANTSISCPLSPPMKPTLRAESFHRLHLLSKSKNPQNSQPRHGSHAGD